MVEKSNKIALILAWNFFKGNYALNFAVIAIFVVIFLLGMIPIIGIIFTIFYSILSISMQTYFAKSIQKITYEKEIIDISSNTKIGDFLGKYVHIGAGAFLALFILSIIFSLLMMMFVNMGGVNIENLQNMAQMQSYAALQNSYIASLFIILIAGFFIYFFPAAMGEVFKSEDFVLAFKNIFLIFNPSFWKRCFNKEYFLLILIWSIIILLFSIIIMALFFTVILIPVALIMVYLLNLYNAAIYLFASDLIKK